MNEDKMDIAAVWTVGHNTDQPVAVYHRVAASDGSTLRQRGGPVAVGPCDARGGTYDNHIVFDYSVKPVRA